VVPCGAPLRRAYTRLIAPQIHFRGVRL